MAAGVAVEVAIGPIYAGREQGAHNAALIAAACLDTIAAKVVRVLDPGAVERLKTTAARYILNWRPSQRILVVWTGPMLVPDSSTKRT